MFNNAHKITGCAQFFGNSPTEKFRKVFRLNNNNKMPCIQTRFYYDVEDRDDFVILNHSYPVIRKPDIARGYVEREWILKKFKPAIQYMRLTPRACLVEFLVEPGPTNTNMKENARVYVH